MIAAILLISSTASFASCTANDDNPSVVQPAIERITERGKLLVGTTGDYRPLSYLESDGNYWGFGIEMAEKIAERMPELLFALLRAVLIAEPSSLLPVAEQK